MDLTNLLAHWRLEEDGATSRVDAHGSRSLTANSSPGSAAGKLGNAVDFSGIGSTQSLSRGDAAFGFGNTDFEFNGWVKFDTLASGMPVFFSSGAVTWCYKLYTNGTVMRFTVSSNGSSWAADVASTVTLSTGVWYFFRCWHDSVGDVIGIRINDETPVTAAHSAGTFTGSFLEVGRRTDGSTVLLDGKVDSLSVWGRVLTAPECEHIYQSGNGLDYPWPGFSVPVALDDFLKCPTLTPIVLAQVTVGIWARNWLVDGTLTNSFKVSATRTDARGKVFSLNLTSVRWNLTTLLTLQTSAANVNTTPGSWYSDGTILWVRPPSGQNIFTNTVQAFATFYFSHTARVLNEVFWEPRMSSVPNLSQRIEALFGGVGQIGGGSMALFNHDGYFNEMQDFQWHHGSVVLRLGVDFPHGRVMEWADYQTIATWSVREWRRDETMFTLNLEEPKAKIKTKVPFTFFDRTTYPNIEDSTVGKPIPVAYGRLLGIKPTLIDPGLKKFKVAGHAIKSFDGVRLKLNREEVRTFMVPTGDWLPYQGAAFRYYLANEEAINVTFNTTSLADENSPEDVVATPGSWGTSENFVYLNPPSGQSIHSGAYAITAKNTVESFATTNFASVNAALAEFTLGNDWAIGTEVSVDFRGKPNADNSVMENPSDIVLDLLTSVGETSIDSTSFTMAKACFQIGTDENGNLVHRMRPAVYLDEAREVLSTIGLINELTGCFLYSDELGRFHMGAFTPEQGEPLKVYNDLDLLDFEEMTDSEETFSKYITRFEERLQDDFAQVETVERAAFQFIAGQPNPVVEERTVELSEERDAEYWTQRQLGMRGEPLKLFTLRLPWNALMRRPGEQVRIESSARQLDQVFEVLEVRRDLSARQVTMVVGNLRNWKDEPGFWVADSDVLPSRFAAHASYLAGNLFWDNARQLDPDIQLWCRQNVGYWCDENGFANSTIADAFLPSVWV